MLSFKDFSDYYDLSEDEIALLLKCLEQHSVDAENPATTVIDTSPPTGDTGRPLES